MCFFAVFLTWRLRRWAVAGAVGAASFLVLGMTSSLIDNPIFGRSVPPTPWAMDVLVLTSILAGLLAATYFRNLSAPVDDDERPARKGLVGGILAYLAIGCPACNKLVIVALGSTGAIQVFAPIQPYLAAAGLLVLVWALYVRLRGEATCAWQPPVDWDTGAAPITEPQVEQKSLVVDGKGN